METQKIINFLNDSSNEEPRFTTKRYLIDSNTEKVKYKQGDTIKSETGSIKSSPCDYSDAYILVTGDITVVVNNKTDIAFTIVHHFLLARQKLMLSLLTKQIIFTLPCLCTI